MSAGLPTDRAPLGTLLNMIERVAAGSPDIELSGEYDLARKQEVAALFAAVNGKASITIDMREVTYVDSTFLNELVTMRLRLQERSVTLVGARPNVVRVLRLAKLDRFFLLRTG
jgi:anti-anti-sigma factor